jgi:succinate dehydrogenase hydrophobic anchor subunit
MNGWMWLAAAYGVVTGVGIVFCTLLTLYLCLSGQRTLSERVWAEPWAGFLVIAWLALGLAGLTLHFFVKAFH